jgi:peroxiredoxin Q/BCP
MMLSWFRPLLDPGTPAPDFELRDQDGDSVRLSALRGSNVVLVFYPGDDTPTCTRQLCEFRDCWDAARRKNVRIIGINPWSAARKAKFRTKYQLPFPLLADPGQRVAALYNTGGLWVRRTVYLIGPDGVIRYARRGKPAPDEVLAAAE